MPRTARLIIDNGYYHIMTRGNDRRKVFQSDSDFVRMLETIRLYLSKHPVLIFHYCLMSNHLHLLLQARKATDLPKFMQRILQVYATYFHKRYDSVGFLFQNRYRSIAIEKETYLLECARYIESNPVRAKICNNPKDYPWSSFLFYTVGKEDGLIEKPNPCYAGLAQNPKDRQRMFRDFVLKEGPYDDIIDRALRIR